MSNPLLDKFETPFGSVPFNLIKNSDFLPALHEAIKEGKRNIEQITGNAETPTFSKVCEALDMAGRRVSVVSAVFFNLNSADSSEERQAIAREFSPMLTDYQNDIILNDKLFYKVKSIYEQRDRLNLNSEEMTLVETQYRQFIRNGALLKDSDKEKLRSLDKEKARISLAFSDNVLHETNDFVLILEDESELDGVPDNAREAAKQEAEKRGHSGKWAITLDYPGYIPIMTYASSRQLRERLYRAFMSRSCKGNDYDNRDNIKKLANIRYERAKLLGYDTHADFVLEERMATSPHKVEKFLDEILTYAKPAAEQEMVELRAYAIEHGFQGELQRWDMAYWSEKLKQSKFGIDDEELRPYFKLDNVIAGAFKVASKLYGIQFKCRTDIPVFNDDVSAFEVSDSQGKHIGVFYTDFFPRSGKRSGAWMTVYRDQYKISGGDIRPHVSIVCNFTKSTDNTPSLLTFNEVRTLFHEFGHALHGLFSNCHYSSLSGTSVYWDFVELPSQLMENWIYEKECLDMFAVHYKTGERIPDELINKIKSSSNFHEGLQTMRQLGFAMLDMGWHGGDPSKIEDVCEFENEIMEPLSFLPPVEGTLIGTAFSHIFSGGYSSGYYSYKWAEVLDADAFENFKEKGIFDNEVAASFRSNILEKGGSEHPMVLYKRFRGHEPTIKPLLRRAGLI